MKLGEKKEQMTLGKLREILKDLDEFHEDTPIFLYADSHYTQPMTSVETYGDGIEFWA